MQKLLNNVFGDVNMTPDKNWVEPDYTKPYRPKQWSKDHFSWVNLMMEPFPTNTPKMHYMMMDLVYMPGVYRKEIIAHRESAKTSIVTETPILRAAMTGEFPGFGKVTNMVIFSETRTMAVDILKNIRNSWESSDDLYNAVKLAKKRDGSYKGNTEAHLCFVSALGTHVHVFAKGKGESLRGTRKDGVRPQIVFFDDIMEDAEITSAREREKTRKWIGAVVSPAMSSTTIGVDEWGNEIKNLMIAVGTPMSEDDQLGLWRKGSTFATLVLPIAQKWGTPDMISSWPDQHSIKKILQDYQEAIESRVQNEFMREKLLITIGEDMTIFKQEYFPGYKMSDIEDRMHEMFFFMSMDAAVSEKESGDDTVIMTIGVDSNDVWYIVAIKAMQMTPRQTLTEIFKQARRFKPMMLKGESAALQQVFAAFIKEEQLKQRIYFPYDTLKANSVKSKTMRIRSLQPRMHAKKIMFPTDISIKSTEKLIEQLKGMTNEGPTTPHIDAADCLANFMDEDFIFAPPETTKTRIKQYTSTYT